MTTRTHRSPASESSAVQPVIEVRSVSNSCGHVQALRDASLEVFPSEVLALMGDKGAGKSTLTNVIGGVVQPDSGSLFFDGAETILSGVRDAQAQGVEVVYQDLAQAPDLSIAENCFLGRERLKPGLAGRLGFLDKSGMRTDSAEALARLGSHIQSLNVLIEQAAPERLLWGSDFSPCLDYVSFAQAADLPYLHELSDEDRESVYGGNLRRVVAGVVR